jgi:hypothetical protein
MLDAYLFSLTFPPLLTLMWPFVCECSFSRVNHPLSCRRFPTQNPILTLNRRNNRPPTIRRMCQMFHKRIVPLLPSIEGFMAQETGDIIGVGLEGVVEETCFCQLRACQYGSSNCTLASHVPVRQRGTCEAISWTLEPLRSRSMPSASTAAVRIEKMRIAPRK